MSDYKHSLEVRIVSEMTMYVSRVGHQEDL